MPGALEKADGVTELKHIEEDLQKTTNTIRKVLKEMSIAVEMSAESGTTVLSCINEIHSIQGPSDKTATSRHLRRFDSAISYITRYGPVIQNVDYLKIGQRVEPNVGAFTDLSSVVEWPSPFLGAHSHG